VSHKRGKVLIDLGLSCREVSRRLAQVEVTPDSIDAILLTHAHGDHTRGAGVFARRHGVPVYATEALWDEWHSAGQVEGMTLEPNESLSLAGFCFSHFEIPHDASETCGFRIETPEGIIGYATDIGALTPLMIELFQDCRVLVIESNHAAELLRVSPYARATRARIAGVGGHLSNESLATFVRDHLGVTVKCLVLAHLSRVNNVPELAEMSCREALVTSGREDVEVILTSQEHVARTVDLSVWLPETAMRARQENLPFLDRVEH